MIDFDRVFESRNKIFERLRFCSGSYSVPLSRIKFEYEKPFKFNVPYNLDEEHFNAWLPKIKKALTWNHETVHFIQAWSTTTGILEFLYIVNQLNQLGHIQQKTSYRLPLEEYFHKELMDPKRQSTSLSNSFVGMLLGYKYQVLNYKWLNGTFPIEAINLNRAEIKTEIPNTFITFDLEFIADWLDHGFDMTEKQYGLFNTFKKISEGKGNNIVTSIGNLHLQECFAKSVEFEHLIWFNPKCADRIIRSWLFDNDALTYNVPFRMLLQVLDLHSKGGLPLPWAHLRVFIDLALMYNDFLELDDSAPFDKSIGQRLEALKINPGVTYYRVLKAFEQVDALRNHEDDIIRLYDDLCRILEIPPIDKMLNKLLRLIDGFLSYQFPDSSLSRFFFTVARELVRRKIEDPRLFINDLIYMPKIQEIYNSVADFVTIVTPTGVMVDRNNPSPNALAGLIMEAHLDISQQLQNTRNIVCPIRRDYKMCIESKAQLKKCGVDGRAYYDGCPVGSIIHSWLENEKGECI